MIVVYRRLFYITVSKFVSTNGKETQIVSLDMKLMPIFAIVYHFFFKLDKVDINMLPYTRHLLKCHLDVSRIINYSFIRRMFVTV